ncbi:MAG: diphthine--ammonia ligase [Firmicutes bacterium]|nr:diphthine--ammonia ligase [Bacillota bacterium]
MSEKTREKVFVSWSAGKDCYLALLKAKENGLDPAALVTFIKEEGRSMAHGLPHEILTRQAESLGLPAVLEPVTWPGYEKGFQRVTGELRQKGFTGGVFGDINLEAHRQWVENACSRAAMNCYLPLWGMAEEAVVSELLERGAQLLIVALRGDLLSKKWLGCMLNEELIQELKEEGLSPCGENGEYHTLVVNGPLFEQKLEISFSGHRQEGKHLFLEYN